jgi:hypothetical protein
MFGGYLKQHLQFDLHLRDTCMELYNTSAANRMCFFPLLLENFPVFTRWKRLFWKFVSLVTSRDWFCQFSEEQGCIFFSNNMQSQQIYVPQGS